MRHSTARHTAAAPPHPPQFLSAFRAGGKPDGADPPEHLPPEQGVDTFAGAVPVAPVRAVRKPGPDSPPDEDVDASVDFCATHSLPWSWSRSRANRRSSSDVDDGVEGGHEWLMRKSRSRSSQGGRQRPWRLAKGGATLLWNAAAGCGRRPWGLGPPSCQVVDKMGPVRARPARRDAARRLPRSKSVPSCASTAARSAPR
jgi:hypothetical protein